MKNILISLAIGFVSIFAIILLVILLLLSGLGIYIGLVFIVGYLFILGLALPLFLHDIAKSIKLKKNLYVKLLIITLGYYVISLIPKVGSLFVFITVLIGLGRFLLNKLKK